MNVGIIGGADGPTQIYVTGGTEWAYIVAAGAFVLGVVIAFFVIRNRRKTRKDDIND